MSIKQIIFLSVLFLFALIGFLYHMANHPLKIAAMFLLTALALFITKRFAIDPAFGNKSLQRPRRWNDGNRNRRIRTPRPHPFRVIEGHKNKKSRRGE